ncbi:MAG: glycosyltransferase family 9 protein [Candidatus Hydrogenedentes bacterium]|nr:glycosyltransferase family 9 protein [Candidatus Hydrogenedentota bacterium]
MARERILVAQMTRMGDVLQTSPLVRALKQRHPDAHITAMVRRMGKAIAECNPDIDDVIVYEEDETYLDLRSDDADRLFKAYSDADAYVQRLVAGRFDVAYNCTHSLCSAMLFKLAGIPEVVGAHLSDDWRYVWRGRGPNYFITSVLHREANDLNICDAFRHFMDDPPATHGLVMEIDDHPRAQAGVLLSQHGISERDFLVCFQLGASDRDKRWPEERFARLAKLLVQRYGARIVLLGVDAEAPLGKAFEQHAPGVAAHLFGKTNIPQLAAILERARVLVTNDTGTMHIAAAVRCPIVLLSVGYVHFRETGPYGAGHCAIEVRRADAGRSDMRGRDTAGESGILPEHALRAVELVITGAGAIPTLEDDGDLANVDLHWSDFAQDGCLQWYPIVRREAAELDVVRMAYRPMWLQYFAQGSNQTFPVQSDRIDSSASETDSIKRIAQHYLPLSDSSFWQSARESLAGLASLADRGAATTGELLTILRSHGAMRRAQGLVRGLMALDEDIRVYAELNRACKPLAAIARFERDNLEGAEPLALAETTLRIYQNIAERARGLMASLEMVREAMEGA